jgi:YHS domain-containing protein
MLPSPDWAILTDPVCGRSVEATSPFRVVHGGALFAFCSPACRAHFVELPSRYAVIASAIQPRRADAAVSAPMPLMPDPPASVIAAPLAEVQAPPVRAAAPAAAPRPTVPPAPQPVAVAAPAPTKPSVSASGRPTEPLPLVATAELPMPAGVTAGVPLPDLQELATAARRAAR